MAIHQQIPVHQVIVVFKYVKYYPPNWRSDVKKSGNGLDGYFHGFLFGKPEFPDGDTAERYAFKIMLGGHVKA